jgi:hypothetical protein
MIKARVHYHGYTDEIELAVMHVGPDGRRYHLPKVGWKEHQPGQAIEPLIAADAIGPDGSEVLQAIMNALWEHGLRPTGFGDIKNETAAIRGHLDDMRALAFGALKMSAPQQTRK